MPPKDRLATLKQNAPPKQNEPSVALSLSEVKIEMSGQGSLDRFFEEVESMNEALELIATNIGNMREKHHLILSSPASDERDKQELERLMDEVKKVAGKVRDQLKIVEERIQQDLTGPITADLRIRQAQQATLSRKFTTIMSEYNKIQTDYREKCKSKIKRQLDIAGRPTTDDQVDEMLESGNLQIFTEGIIADSQQAKQALADVEARHQDIVKLETNIRELRDMFVDMALLVEAQGEMVDRIEYNVEHATEFVAQAKEETKKAVEYQSSARRKKICLIITAIIVVIIIVLAIAIPIAEKYQNDAKVQTQNSETITAQNSPGGKSSSGAKTVVAAVANATSTIASIIAPPATAQPS
ncbi:hypothetical protein RvY_11909 [Ramazzottius varieornatus]|uniref:t-SNARE coiled-coil homology domain-containing protein n=1 Tax=Ramazzottius varieornatus TaxID=947166 RepID=A0A1D1VHL9_RAMVA|nr:hypothetical protein RvY_11909 [Ramazzottius varieornatus]